MVGLSYSNPTNNYCAIDYTMYTENNGNGTTTANVYAFENCQIIGHLAGVSPGYTLRLARENGNIVYYVNGTALRTLIDPNPTATMEIDIAMNSNTPTHPVWTLTDLKVGKMHYSPNWLAFGADYRYGFQNQEVDNEIKGDGNSVNFKYRMHDPRVGRFFALDPLKAKYPHNSPYAFSENVVISHKELEGLEKESAIFGEATNKGTGKLIIVDDKKLYDSYLENAVANGFDILYIPKNETEGAPYVLDMERYSKLTSAYCTENGVELDILIVNCHGSGNGITVGYNDENFPDDRSYSKMGSSQLANSTGGDDGLNKATGDFVNMVFNVKEDGVFVLAACGIGEDFSFGSNLVNALGKNVNIYTNMDNTAVPTTGILNTPLTTQCGISGGWNLTNSSGMTQLNSAISVSGEGVSLSEPNPTCVTPNTPPDE